MNMHHLLKEGEANLQKTDLNSVKEWLKHPFGTVIACFSQSDYERLCGACDEIKKLPVLIATPRCLNPENCVVVCPAECFDFSFFSRVIVSGHPLTDGYLAYLDEVSNECYALGECTAQRISVSDDTLRHVYKEIVNLASRTTKMGSPHKMSHFVRDIR